MICVKFTAFCDLRIRLLYASSGFANLRWLASTCEFVWPGLNVSTFTPLQICSTRFVIKITNPYFSLLFSEFLLCRYGQWSVLEVFLDIDCVSGRGRAVSFRSTHCFVGSFRSFQVSLSFIYFFCRFYYRLLKWPCHVCVVFSGVSFYPIWCRPFFYVGDLFGTLYVWRMST